MTTILAPCFATILTGRLIFSAVFGLLILWLLFIPRSRLADADLKSDVAPWRNVRYWAIAIAASQMFVYLLWR